MDRNTDLLTVIFTVLALVIVGVFLYRIRNGTFKKHLMAEAAIVVSYIVVSGAASDMAFLLRLAITLSIAGVFVYGRMKSD
ncbi:hypothetical protein [Paenibacillus sp. 22594]|uniref:hypothetical protein n=1 Tax=Paenibacillus sp. 22594 TaxID=3453947 RepID=UPI003F83B8E4